MSFNSKIADYFLNPDIKLGTKPAEHLTHQYADYVEIVSLFSNNNFVTSADILDRFRDEDIIRKKRSDKDRAEGNDKNESWISEIFRVIVDRSNLYGNDYPFELLNNDKIKLKKSNLLGNRQKIYLSLLLASSLNIFQSFESELTTEFELISFYALKEYMPSHASVKSIGKNTEYKGTALEKIENLAVELKAETDPRFLKNLSKKGIQERGLDLIGWIPFRDNVSNHFSILCQCACGKEWFKKLIEARRYESYLKFHCNKPTYALFIPYSLINFQDSDFYQSDEISVSTLIFERKRILNFISNDSFFDTCDSKKLVDRCITYEEDIV